MVAAVRVWVPTLLLMVAALPSPDTPPLVPPSINSVCTPVMDWLPLVL